MGGPKVAIWTDSSRTRDSVAPGSVELVVVGGVHVEREDESGIE